MNPIVKIFLELVNLLFNNPFGFLLARKLKLFDAVFVMYPADREFSDYFTFRSRQWLIKWRPFIVGMAKHPSGKRTLMFAISAFVDGKDGSAEVEMLRVLHDRTNRIKELIGATSTHFAGTLPGRFSALRIRRGENQKNERIATQNSVVKAIHLLRTMLGHNNGNPVVILGSNGFIGKGVTEELMSLGIQVIGIDKAYNSQDFYKKPGVPHVIVNIMTPEAINGYVDEGHMGEHTVLLNEVYPAPHRDVVASMQFLGVKVFHIAGVKALTIPSFPVSYGGALPCCAALPGEEYAISLVEL